MSIFSAIGDIFSNESSHIGDMLHSWEKSPGKTLEQFALGAQDPLGAKLWGGITGQKFTPSVGQMGGETNAQFQQSKAEGVHTGTSQTLGQIANVVAAVWGGAEAGGALGGAAGGGGGAAEGGAAGSAGEGAAGSSALGIGAGTETTAGAAETSMSSDAALEAGNVGGAGGAGAGGAASGSGSGSGAEPATAGSNASSAASSSKWMDYAKTTAKVLAPTVVSSLLQPKPPKTKAPTAMPDPLAQQQATQQKLIAQLARRGRASTILTNPGNAGGSLGG